MTLNDTVAALAGDPKRCTDPACLGGTLPRETWTHADYLALKDHRSPCPMCRRAGRKIANGTEADAWMVELEWRGRLRDNRPRV